VDLDEQAIFAEQNCREYMEHELMEARQQMAEAVSSDWRQRADTELELRLKAENEKFNLQRQLRETQVRMEKAEQKEAEARKSSAVGYLRAPLQYWLFTPE
jgi:hypothetical protein